MNLLKIDFNYNYLFYFAVNGNLYNKIFTF